MITRKMILSNTIATILSYYESGEASVNDTFSSVLMKLKRKNLIDNRTVFVTKYHNDTITNMNVFLYWWVTKLTRNKIKAKIRILKYIKNKIKDYGTEEKDVLMYLPRYDSYAFFKGSELFTGDINKAQRVSEDVAREAINNINTPVILSYKNKKK